VGIFGKPAAAIGRSIPLRFTLSLQTQPTMAFQLGRSVHYTYLIRKGITLLSGKTWRQKVAHAAWLAYTYPLTTQTTAIITIESVILSGKN
jgi:hypothetical protein